jgi:hypothetical protein
MKHLKKLVNESMSLTVFEMLTMLQNFLHEKYGIKAFGAKEDNGFVMYMSKYLNGQDKPEDISEEIKKFVEKDCHMENVEVHKDIYGYHITFGHNAQSAKLMEVTQADGSGISGAKTTYVCHFCKNKDEGYGNDPWPVDNDPLHRVCNNCNDEFVIPARIEQMYKKQSKTEAIDRKDVDHSASNVVLDDKYIWLFNVLDKNGRDIEEGIEYLQDAIDVLIKNNAAFLVAFPYIDPKPNDPNVELVFADNPGPAIIYNNEEVTISKKELERPTTERPVKTDRPEETDKEEQEEEVEESVSTFKNTPEKEIMLIDTNLSGVKNKEILDSVLGQLSDGMWENSPAMKKYWQNIRIEEQDGRLYLKVKTYGNDQVLVYLDKTPEQLKIWYAKKIKEIIKREIEDYDEKLGQWSRDNENVSAYLGYNEDITVADAYKAYETMLGRSTQSKYNKASQNEIAEDDMKIKNAQVMKDKEKKVLLEEKPELNKLNESKETFFVAIDFTPSYYDAMDEAGIDESPYEVLMGQIPALEEMIYNQWKNNDITVSFDYVGQKYYDIASNMMSEADAEKIAEQLQDFLGEWAIVKVLVQPL